MHLRSLPRLGPRVRVAIWLTVDRAGHRCTPRCRRSRYGTIFLAPRRVPRPRVENQHRRTVAHRVLLRVPRTAPIRKAHQTLLVVPSDPFVHRLAAHPERHAQFRRRQRPPTPLLDQRRSLIRQVSFHGMAVSCQTCRPVTHVPGAIRHPCARIGQYLPRLGRTTINRRAWAFCQQSIALAVPRRGTRCNVSTRARLLQPLRWVRDPDPGRRDARREHYALRCQAQSLLLPREALWHHALGQSMVWRAAPSDVRECASRARVVPRCDQHPAANWLR